jgi:Uma2 family endonuclease
MTVNPQRYAWTYDEYARLPDDGNRYEVIDGEVLVTPAPSTDHQRILLRLSKALDDYVEREGFASSSPTSTSLFVTGQFLRPRTSSLCPVPLVTGGDEPRDRGPARADGGGACRPARARSTA